MKEVKEKKVCNSSHEYPSHPCSTDAEIQPTAAFHKVSHGDIRSENILVTSWNWVYITDFASYKPVYLPEDDPTNYSYFFDISGRRTCYIAPERFFSSSEKEKMKTEEQHTVTEAMDVFSVGCVIAELFLEGRDTFSLSQLFKYRAGELDIGAHIAAIDDESIKVTFMLSALKCIHSSGST